MQFGNRNKKAAQTKKAHTVAKHSKLSSPSTKRVATTATATTSPFSPAPPHGQQQKRSFQSSHQQRAPAAAFHAYDEYQTFYTLPLQRHGGVNKQDGGISQDNKKKNKGLHADLFNSINERKYTLRRLANTASEVATTSFIRMLDTLEDKAVLLRAHYNQQLVEDRATPGLWQEAEEPTAVGRYLGFAPAPAIHFQPLPKADEQFNCLHHQNFSMPAMIRTNSRVEDGGEDNGELSVDQQDDCVRYNHVSFSRSNSESNDYAITTTEPTVLASAPVAHTDRIVQRPAQSRNAAAVGGVTKPQHNDQQKMRIQNHIAQLQQQVLLDALAQTQLHHDATAVGGGAPQIGVQSRSSSTKKVINTKFVFKGDGSGSFTHTVTNGNTQQSHLQAGVIDAKNQVHLVDQFTTTAASQQDAKQLVAMRQHLGNRQQQQQQQQVIAPLDATRVQQFAASPAFTSLRFETYAPQKL